LGVAGQYLVEKIEQANILIECNHQMNLGVWGYMMYRSQSLELTDLKGNNARHISTQV